MIINYQPLSFFTSLLQQRRPVAINKHSDASLYCMQGIEGGDCNGCAYTPHLREALIKSITHPRPTYYPGVQRLQDRDREGMDNLLLSFDMRPAKLTWLDTGIFAASLMEGRLYPLLKTLHSLDRVTIVSNKRIRAINDLELKIYDNFIEVPESNAYEARTQVSMAVEDVEDDKPGAIFLFSCGMAATAMIHELCLRHPQSLFLDLGHVWDALLGNKLRYYLHDVSETTLKKNLRPCV